MLKKGLIKTCINEYLDKHSIETVQDVVQALPEIYKHLKNHPHHKDLIPEELKYQEFVHWAKVGFHQATNGGNVFVKLKKQFNSF